MEAIELYLTTEWRNPSSIELSQDKLSAIIGNAKLTKVNG